MKRKLLHTAFSLAFTLMLSIALAQNGTINGTVLGREGALQMATVAAGKMTVLTDKNGRFSISISPGTHTLTITHAGYKKVIQNLTVTNGNTQSIDFMLMPSGEMGEVVVLGSRSVVQRSNLRTPVPVDVISSQHLVQTGQTSLTQMLQFSVPSFNASQHSVNESVTLRGLNPDHLLILVNGSRYHNMAYLHPGMGPWMLGLGSVLNDLNSIPFSAIEKIEILRDGASAQYGSDAIAGVINIILKKSTGKTSIQSHLGQHYRGDGENISLGINRGFVFHKKGFLNFSADLRYRNHTYRGGDYQGTVYTADKLKDDSLIQARNFDRSKVSNIGNASLRGFGLIMNGGHSVGKQTELFWTAAWNNRKTVLLGPYRLPKITIQVNPELFPDGFKGLPNHNSQDFSGIAGAKGVTKNQWYWEWSHAYGNNTDRYYAKNTNNASQQFTLGKNAPTSFYTGTLIYQQSANALHVSKKSLATSGSILNTGFGMEWRLEHYRTKAGEEASWQDYDGLGGKQGGANHGLIIRPENVVNEVRNVVGAYVDLESEFNNRLLINLAGRYEYYSDFGGNHAGKLAIRYKCSNWFSLRGSVSNGFRAPSLQQRYYSLTSRGFALIGGVAVPSRLGIFSNNSEVAKAFGIPLLQAERSVNLSGGFTATAFNRISLTVDAYWIKIKNRVVLSGIFSRIINHEVDSLLGGLEVDRVRFFANAIHTTTRGIDVVLNSNWKINKATLTMMLAANFTRTQLFGAIKTAGKLTPDSLNTHTLFSREERARVENGQPRDKIILSLNYKTGRFGFLLRNTHFGKTMVVFDSNDRSLDEIFSPKILTDCSISYTPKTWLTITAGANNLLDVYPDRVRNYRNTGEGIYTFGPAALPFGYNGGYYFMSMGFSF